MRLNGTQDALLSYRYLRLSLIGLVGFIGLSVVIERLTTDRNCFQPSISDYYYTPAQAAFVGALVAIGVCLIALKSTSGGEDVLLNLAGMMAPVVALVPTLAGEASTQCSSVPVNAGNTEQNVQNNMLALLLLTSVVLVVIGYDMVKNRTSKHDRDRVGYLIAVVVVAGLGIWFGFGFESFLTGAHYVAALLLFVFIWCVVLLNAEGPVPPAPPATRVLTLVGEVRRWLTVFFRTVLVWKLRWRNIYGLIAFVMFWSVLIQGLFWWLADWPLGLLWIEATQILLFAIFWAVQTAQKWDADKEFK